MPAQILTVSVEEFFHGEALRPVVAEKHWQRFGSRLQPALDRILALLDETGARATFFVLGHLAERHPEPIRAIAEAGHEVATQGYWPRGIAGMGRADFRTDLEAARRAVEAASGRAVLGYRAPRWLGADEEWVLDEVGACGLLYDSSLYPRLWRPGDGDDRPHRNPTGLWEVPVSLTGEELRLGRAARLLRRLRQQAQRQPPLVLALRSWEMDPEQPRVTAGSRAARRRQYHNLERMPDLLRPYLQEFRWVAVREHLELPEPGPRAAAPPPATAAAGPAPEVRGPRTPVSVVVPMFDEADNVPLLLKTMASVQERLADRYEIELVLVDDGSRDGTQEVLQELCAGRRDVRLLRHPQNLGVAQAILTGIRGASHEVVVSIDCDGSYDPHEIEHLLPLLEGADLVTASPYHPQGRVLHVPGWRLLLSRTLSRLYRLVLRSDLHTFTSCFRAYRRSAVEQIELTDRGFLGVAEMLVAVLGAGGRVVEYPTVLESRLVGFSKMRTLRTIRAHLGMLWGILWGRFRTKRAEPARGP